MMTASVGDDEPADGDRNQWPADQNAERCQVDSHVPVDGAVQCAQQHQRRYEEHKVS